VARRLGSAPIPLLSLHGSTPWYVDALQYFRPAQGIRIPHLVQSIGGTFRRAGIPSLRPPCSSWRPVRQKPTPFQCLPSGLGASSGSFIGTITRKTMPEEKSSHASGQKWDTTSSATCKRIRLLPHLLFVAYFCPSPVSGPSLRGASAWGHSRTFDWAARGILPCDST